MRHTDGYGCSRPTIPLYFREAISNTHETSFSSYRDLQVCLMSFNVVLDWEGPPYVGSRARTLWYGAHVSSILHVFFVTKNDCQ